jgi:hypothetical protein
MLKQEKQHKSECDSESHSEHLCYLISQGFHISDEKEFRTLVENPRFQCRHCNRTANSKKNLCVPFDL